MVAVNLKDQRQHAGKIVRLLKKMYPDASCALVHDSPLQLLVATILSAQCTDVRVNMVTPALFARFPDAAAFAGADIQELEKTIQSTGFFRNKARNIKACCTLIVERFGGAVPGVLEELVELPGIGRKTANVVLGNCFDTPGITVDTHVGRLSRRLGLSAHTDPEKVERDLMALMPAKEWTLFSHRMIFHGRQVCFAQARLQRMCSSEDLPANRGFLGKRIFREKHAMDALLERFCRYVRMDTQADEKAASYPSSPGQLALGRVLAEELRALGLRDAEQDEHGVVLATVPATVARAVPVIAWIAHVDTSPETSGTNVQPVIHKDYRGGDIRLPGDQAKVIRTAENPELAELVGKTLITSDGTTLLGADDKAGVAVIVEAAAYLLAHPELPHGPIKICFTCDEEIGHGVDHVDLQKLGAVTGYTLDGAGVGQIDLETFSADLATVRIRGVNLHPSIAKGKMINAVRLAGIFIERLPRNKLTPETTEGMHGFLHPYRIEGGVAETTMRIILRDFKTSELARQADLLRSIGQSLEKEFPGAAVDVAITPQYRNMADGLIREPRAAAFAEEAMRRAGVEPSRTSVRGGTDGSRLTEMGLPTPNLSTGEHNPHSPLEWTCLEEMHTAVKVLCELAQVWAK